MNKQKFYTFLSSGQKPKLDKMFYCTKFMVNMNQKSELLIK
jgi:hypothetical protein